MSLFKRFKSSKDSKHSKLGEGWAEHKDPLKSGIQFHLKYMGSVLVDELRPGESYSSGRSTDAIQTIHDLNCRANKSFKHLPRVSVFVTSKGINVNGIHNDRDLSDTPAIAIDAPIDRISFCTADKCFRTVFAFIARNSVNETVECHAFLCPKIKIAHDVTYAVNQAFQLAADEHATKYAAQATAHKLASHEDSTDNSASKLRQNWVSFEDENVEEPTVSATDLCFGSIAS